MTIQLQLDDNSRKTFYIHILVAYAFIGENNNNYLVHHKNCDPSYNFYTNLQYMNKSDHEIYHTDNISIKYLENKGEWSGARYGESNGMSKWTEELVIRMFEKLLSGMSYKDTLLSEGLEPNNNNISNLSHIFNGHRWKYIYDKYK